MSETPSEPNRWPVRAIILTLLAGWLIALPLDRPIAIAFHSAGIDHAIKGRWYAEVLKGPGFFGYAAPAVLLLGLFNKLNWREVGITLLAMALSGLNVILKWIIGRTRPFHLPGANPPYPFVLHPFWHGIYGLLHEKDLSFPSGHACMAAATLACLIAFRPRWVWGLLIIAFCVGLERVAENAHYSSDVIAGYASGMAAAWWARRLFGRDPKERSTVPHAASSSPSGRG